MKQVLLAQAEAEKIRKIGEAEAAVIEARARDFPDPGIEPGSPTFQAESLPSEPPGKLPKLSLASLKQGASPRPTCQCQGTQHTILSQVQEARADDRTQVIRREGTRVYLWLILVHV